MPAGSAFFKENPLFLKELKKFRLVPVIVIDDAESASPLAEAILALLQGRGIPVDTPLETRVRACRERDTLHRWLLRAARVERGEQLFDAQ